MENTNLTGSSAQPVSDACCEEAPRSLFLRNVGELASAYEILSRVITKPAAEKEQYRDSSEQAAVPVSFEQWLMGLVFQTFVVSLNQQNYEKRLAQRLEATEPGPEPGTRRNPKPFESLFEEGGPLADGPLANIFRSNPQVASDVLSGLKPGEGIPFGDGFLMRAPHGMPMEQAIGEFMDKVLSGVPIKQKKGKKAKAKAKRKK